MSGHGWRLMVGQAYANLDLLFDRLHDGTYRVRVISSPVGQASREFMLPFSADEMADFIHGNGSKRGASRSLDIANDRGLSVHEFGKKLYDAVFAGKIAECFRASQVLVGDDGKGLRIRLRFSGTPELINIPWELLFDSENGRFVALSAKTPIVRGLDISYSGDALSVSGSLRVLVMIASPQNYPVLDVEGEWGRINQATKDLQASGKIIFDRLAEASLSGLQHILRKHSYHVFHYIGHGDFDPDKNDGVLALETEDGKANLVDGKFIGTLLHDAKSLKLVLLNSCSGAKTSGVDPFSGIGQSLMQQGIPAVVAMQSEITDVASVTFAHEFYSALMDGYPVDAAVAEARKRIYSQPNEVEWAIPVLYMNIDDGHLFEIQGDGNANVSLNNKTAAPESLGFLNVDARKSKGSLGNLKHTLLALGAVSGLAALAFIFAPQMSDDIKCPDRHVHNPKESLDAQMVDIPAVSFEMGSKSSDDIAAHKVDLAGFSIDKYKVTNFQYKQFIKATNHKAPKTWSGVDFPSDKAFHPVTGVTWGDAVVYCKWTNKRLPTEAEWEYICRGKNNYLYPWGNKSAVGLSNMNGLCVGTTVVGSFASKDDNAYQVADIFGNAFEWTSSKLEAYPYIKNDEREAVEDNSAIRVVRGRHFGIDMAETNCLTRIGASPKYKAEDLGFRCAKDY